jgi:ABC-type nitrate/sulfonate/bicarbonate transport system permease component
MSVTQAESRAEPRSAPAIDADVNAEQQAARARAKAQQRKWMAANIAIRMVSLVVVLGGWEYVGRQINPVLFTYPTAVASAAVKMIASGELWQYLSQSLIVLGGGLGLAVVFGIALGVVMARFWVIDIALDTYITALYSIPSVALVPVLVLWIGFETSAKIVIVFLFTFFPMVINTYQGVKNVDARLLEVGRAFRCSERQLWGNVILPAALPFIVAGLRLSIGRGLIGMVLADLYTAITGIGYLISRYASIYRTDAMFVPVVTLGVLGITLTGLLRLIERRVTPWMHYSGKEND